MLYFIYQSRETKRVFVEPFSEDESGKMEILHANKSLNTKMFDVIANIQGEYIKGVFFEFPYFNDFKKDSEERCD